MAATRYSSGGGGAVLEHQRAAADGLREAVWDPNIAKFDLKV